MSWSSDIPPYTLGTPPRYLVPALVWLRWLILAAMLLIAIVWPLPSRTGQPLWPYLVAFVGYNLVVELLRRLIPRLVSFSWVPLVDLPMAGLFYWFDTDPTGPMFGLFYLAVISAAISFPVWATILYTAAAVVLVIIVAPTLPLWPPAQPWDLGVRLALLSLVGVGTAVLARLLVQEAAASEAIRREAKHLAELEHLRGQFIASVSHDLRTPLTAIRAGLGMLAASLEDRLRPEERDLLGNTQRNVTRLRVLIDDLLAHNQLTAGVLQLDRQELDLRALVDDAAAVVQPLFQAKAQSLSLHLPEPLPVSVDPQRLVQVLVNVLANAYHHTPNGTRIAVRATESRSTQDVHVLIHDNGPGVPPDQQDQIFQRFHYLSTRGGGSGLGLAISRDLIELHGGRIWAESQPGEGLTIHILLPRYQPGDAS